ncbi:unnamed protein product [Parnassius mnemosyne]|uniref:RNase H type-1 domain-containing protein n=1 Tax=Parnassius mnemosyne TaxID=213953 RepID=A0AAV1KD76_9NEOP
MSTITVSWKGLCSKQEKETIWQSINRIIRKCTTISEDKLLRLREKTLNPDDSAMLLAKVFYPEDEVNKGTEEQGKVRDKSNAIIEDLRYDSINFRKFTEEEIEMIIQKMNPKKAPGEDGIVSTVTSDICYEAYKTSLSTLKAIFNKCLQLGHFPEIWKKAVIKVIPKPGKDDYSVPKSTNRPIGLLPAYADDILVIAKGHSANAVEEKLNPALTRKVAWGNKYKLNFAPHKTQAIVITKKLSYEIPTIKMNNIIIKPSSSLKVLDITFDTNLNFVEHLDEVLRKALNIYKTLSRTARANWGLNSEIVKTIYVAVVEPTVLYAASVWATVAKKEYIRKRLERISRMFAIKICKVHRTISFTSLKPLTQLPGRTIEKPIRPFCLPHPAEKYRVSFKMVVTQEEENAIEGLRPRLYTDGSKLEDKVGGAVSVWREGKEILKSTFRLESYCSVYQAELTAILKALDMMCKISKLKKAIILSDSRSECLTDSSSLHSLAVEIRERLKELKNKDGDIEFYWVKAHIGISGNERADELAKKAALTNKQAAAYDKCPMSFAKRLTRNSNCMRWQQRYNKVTTGAVTKIFFPDIRQAHLKILK